MIPSQTEETSREEKAGSEFKPKSWKRKEESKTKSHEGKDENTWQQPKNFSASKTNLRRNAIEFFEAEACQMINVN